ncbi:MAG: UDP-N-acetylmuramoyl-tripeptide--D-alanyl-D-alanine ligase [Coriobacteriia bacterium]|nr:UDP-N-acetylmuramoyl-tripeptide--D-alanyl-D-alanine ligase [Coriobacteriia bacterium]
MLTLSTESLVEIVDGELLVGSGSTMVNGLAVDSRFVEPGNAFVAFVGEHVDGHRYICEAVEHGARALIVTHAAGDLTQEIECAGERDSAVVRVGDALRAVQDLAAHHRGRLFCPVVGVTGSTGKTTTKDFLTSVLSQHYRVVATEGNQNNELGVPITVLQAGADTDVLVVEMAMRGLGQIARLAEIARPTAGLVTNVGASHLELLGTQEAIASAKAELLRAVGAEGQVFLNCDDALSAGLAAETAATVVFYGLSDGCDVQAIDIETDEESRPRFTLVTSAGSRDVALGVPGRHNIYNALATAAVALSLQVGLDEIVEGLQVAQAADMRMQSFMSASGIQVINDAYNANPTSMRAAIETLAEMRVEGRRLAVLGDMAELGSLTELAHFRIGEEIARLPIEVLVTVGSRARRIVEGARAEGMPEQNLRPCASPEEASEVLDDLLEPGDVVLVKASRVMGLERIVEGIVNPRV